MNTAPFAPLQGRAAAHTGYSRALLASASINQAAKAAMSVQERVGSYSGNLALATRRDRVRICSSIQMQTTPFQWHSAVSNGASKFPGSETRGMWCVRELLKNSRYFVVPKRDGVLRPILDLRPINRVLCKHSFWMITLKHGMHFAH